MNAYESIKKAAEHIRSHPYLYQFSRAFVPKCGTPGCLLGWIGFFSGVKEGENVLGKVALEILELPGFLHSGHTFYKRMDEITGSYSCWRDDPFVAAAGLRAYAEKYHAPAKPAKRPTSAVVADLVATLGKQTIPEGEIASPEYVS